VFFAFFYNNHLHFEEQYQLFLLTWDYFSDKLSYPGGFAGYTGSFLTQFYYISLAGPLIIVFLLYAVQYVTKKIFLKINPDRSLFIFSFLPPLFGAMILCNEFYPLSVIAGFLIANSAAWLYISLKSRKYRIAAGMILIPVIYWLAGGSYISFLLIVIVYELLLLYNPDKKSPAPQELAGTIPVYLIWLAAYLAVGTVIPLLVRQYLIMQPLMMTYLSEFYYRIRTTIPTAAIVLFVLPALTMIILRPLRIREKRYPVVLAAGTGIFIVICFLGFRSFANFSAEEVMTYDYLVRSGRWDDAVRHAGRKPPRNYLSLSMLNLSLAKTGQLGNKMFSFPQRGDQGLFLSFSREYVAPMMGNEILFNLGFTNASQEYVFESMETIPDLGKSARAIKRLAETNLINGQYKVAEKYITLLEKTIFYRGWARNAKGYLNNEEKINNDPVWGEKRRFAVTNDYFFTIKNIEASLAMMAKDHPGNRIAFEYLMAFYMINKDLRSFLNLVPSMEKMNYREVPVSYQEALMYVIGLSNKDPMTNSPAWISQSVKDRMKAYADIYTNYQDAGERLKKNFSGTYWYYLHFTEQEKKSGENKK
jgi:hypothetical protein